MQTAQNKVAGLLETEFRHLPEIALCYIGEKTALRSKKYLMKNGECNTYARCSLDTNIIFIYDHVILDYWGFTPNDRQQYLIDILRHECLHLETKLYDDDPGFLNSCQEKNIPSWIWKRDYDITGYPTPRGDQPWERRLSRYPFQTTYRISGYPLPGEFQWRQRIQEGNWGHWKLDEKTKYLEISRPSGTYRFPLSVLCYRTDWDDRMDYYRRKLAYELTWMGGMFEEDFKMAVSDIFDQDYLEAIPKRRNVGWGYLDKLRKIRNSSKQQQKYSNDHRATV